MTGDDITDGGRRRIGSQDRTRNLREREGRRRKLEGVPIACALPYTPAQCLEDERAPWDQLGQETSTPALP